MNVIWGAWTVPWIDANDAWESGVRLLIAWTEAGIVGLSPLPRLDIGRPDVLSLCPMTASEGIA